MANERRLLNLPQQLRDYVWGLVTSLHNIQLFSAPTRECRLLALPRELRDEIWTEVVISYLNSPRDTQGQYLGCKRLRDLLAFNRQIKEEIFDVFRTSRIFNFYVGGGACVLRDSLQGTGPYLAEPDSPNPFKEIGHISILPYLTTYAHCEEPGDMNGGWVHYPWVRPPSSVVTGVQSTVYLSAAENSNWHNVTPGLACSLYLLVGGAPRLKSLEIPVVMLLNATVTRALRRIRGVELHLAFTDAKVDILPLPQRRRDDLAFATPPRERKWLGETGELDLVLPVYEGEQATTPRGLVPLSRLGNAIRTEVASSDRPLSNHGCIQQDVPLWIDVSDAVPLPSHDVSLPPLASGWFKFVARDPGVCCLERSAAPQPTSADISPRTKGALRRARKEWRAMRTSVACGCSECLRTRNTIVDYERVSYLKRNKCRNVVIKGGTAQGVREPHWVSRWTCRRVARQVR